MRNDRRQGLKSHECSVGVMQLMPSTARGLGLTVNDSVGERFDPEMNIWEGVKEFEKSKGYAKKHFDSESRSKLAIYNAGIGKVLKHNGVTNFEETKKYIKTIKNIMENFR